MKSNPKKLYFSNHLSYFLSKNTSCKRHSNFCRRKKGYFNVVIDVPRGSNNKYEYDHHLGCFRLDRVIHNNMYYPVDYGFIPQTLSEDGDSCDVCLLTTNPTFTGCLIKTRPIGILYTSDNAGDDPKIIAAPT